MDDSELVVMVWSILFLTESGVMSPDKCSGGL
jgi:hypothetical protein